MKKYIVKCEVNFGPDDTYVAEYSGIWHEDEESAYKELKKALDYKDKVQELIDAWVDSNED